MPESGTRQLLNGQRSATNKLGRMTHVVEAVIAADSVLGPFVDRYRHARAIQLPQELILVPITEALYDEVTSEGPLQERFERLSTALIRELAELSVSGPVAYIETEYFGGIGEQSAIAWRDRCVVVGPVFSAEGAAAPVNQVLRFLGVVVTPPAFDEFDSVGLGTYRTTGDWAARIR